MYRVAIVGRKESVIGFSPLGIEIFNVENEESAEKKLNFLIKNNYGIIYITEEFAQGLSQKIKKLQEETTVTIIPIPGISNNNGIGMKNVKKYIEAAVGQNILGI